MKNFFITEDQAQSILDGAKRKSNIRELCLRNESRFEISKGVYLYELSEVMYIFRLKNKRNRFDKD